jgi:CHRD domain/PEP-CTERM motif
VTTLTSASLLPDPADGINTFAEAVNAIEAGQTYFNIHTVAFPGGEIAGQITVIPEPASLTLLTLGLGGILAIARFGRRLAA